MEKEYDKNRLLNNIEFLVKRSNKKIGDIEAQCGVSVGYFSRMRNSNSDELSPSAEVLLRLSTLLGASLTSLLKSDYGSMTETELFIQTFLEGVIKKTEADEIFWEKHLAYELSYENTGASLNDLPIVYRPSASLHEDDYYYNSLFTDRFVSLDNCYYKLEFKGKTYFLMSVSDTDRASSSEYELYLLLPDESFKPVCCSANEAKPSIAKLLRDLYISAEKSTKQIRIDEDVRKTLEDFLSDGND